MTRSRTGGLLAAAVMTLGALAGCGTEEPDSASPEPTSSPTGSPTGTPTGTPDPTETPRDLSTPDEEQPQTVEVRFEGDTVTPQGERVEATAGEPLVLRITADRPGEIHVHSSPEQEIEYDAGTTEKSLTIDKPGVVEVESHTLELLIMQLEVR